MSKEYDVVYTVDFKVRIKVEDGEDPTEVAQNIDIPESPLEEGIGVSKYKFDSFSILSIADAETGEEVLESEEVT